MAWNEAVVTNSGLELLTRCVMGRSVEITSAVGGESVSPTVLLLAVKEIAGANHLLQVAKIDRLENGVRVNVRAQNSGLSEGYRLRQIGIFAKIAGSDDEPVLLALIQDKDGEEIPTEEENPEYLLEYDFVIPLGNAENISVSVTPNTFAALDDLEPMNRHIEDNIRHITAAERTAWNSKAAGDHTHTAADVGALTNIKIGTVTTGAAGSSAAASASTSGTVTTLNLTIPKGDTGAAGAQGAVGTAAGFGTPTATVDANVGTPSVTVTASGANTAKVFNFAFKNLKGAKGDKGDKGDTGATGATGAKGATGATGATPTIKVAAGSNIGSVGTPSVTASTSGTTTTFTFNYLKGATGAAGTNATTTAVATQSKNGLMSAADKKKLDDIVSSSGAKALVTMGNVTVPKVSASSSSNIVKGTASVTVSHKVSVLICQQYNTSEANIVVLGTGHTSDKMSSNGTSVTLTNAASSATIEFENGTNLAVTVYYYAFG